MTVLHTSVNSYSFDQTFEAARNAVGVRNQGSDSTTYFGPSPFEVPEHITITAAPKGDAIVEFDYADNEKPEHDFRLLKVDQSLAIRVGAMTKRIVAIRFASGVLEGLQPDHAWLDKVLTDLSQEVHGRQATNALSMNTRVVRFILQKLTGDFLKLLAQAEIEA